MSNILARAGKRCGIFKQVWPVIKEHIEKVNVDKMANYPLNEREGSLGSSDFSVSVGPHSISNMGKQSYLVSFRLTVRIEDECSTMPELQQAVAEEVE